MDERIRIVTARNVTWIILQMVKVLSAVSSWLTGISERFALWVYPELYDEDSFECIDEQINEGYIDV